MRKIITLIIVFVCIQSLNAQNTFNLDNKSSSIYLRSGIEPTVGFALGYMQSLTIQSIEKKLVLFGEISGPKKDFGFNNYETKVGGIINAYKYKNFGITYNLNFSTGHVSTKNFGSQKFAFANKLLSGYFKPKWYIVFTGEHEKIFANKITNTQYYRDYIYPEAKDGWYNGAGGNIQLGLETGLTIKELVDVRFELKIPKSEKFNSYYGSPAHINLIFAYRF